MNFARHKPFALMENEFASYFLDGLHFPEGMNSMDDFNNNRRHPVELVGPVANDYMVHTTEETRDDDALVPLSGGGKNGPWRTLFFALGFNDWESQQDRDSFRRLLDDARRGLNISRKWQNIPERERTEYIDRFFQHLSSRAPEATRLTKSTCALYLKQRSNNRAKYNPDERISANNNLSGEQIPTRNKRRKYRNVNDSSPRVQDTPKPSLAQFHPTTKTNNHSLPEGNLMRPFSIPLRNDVSKRPTEGQYTGPSQPQWNVQSEQISYGEGSGCAGNGGRNMARSIQPAGHSINSWTPAGRFDSMVKPTEELAVAAKYPSVEGVQEDISSSFSQEPASPPTKDLRRQAQQSSSSPSLENDVTQLDMSSDLVVWALECRPKWNQATADNAVPATKRFLIELLGGAKGNLKNEMMKIMNR